MIPTPTGQIVLYLRNYLYKYKYYRLHLLPQIYQLMDYHNISMAEWIFET